MFVKLFDRAEEYFFGNLALNSLAGDEFNAYMTGITINDLNPVYIKNINNIEQNIDRIRSFYNNEAVPYNLIIPQKICHADIDILLEKNNYIKIGQSKAMIAILEDNVTNREDQNYKVKHDNDLLNWSIPVAQGFGAADEIMKQYRQLYINIQNRKLNFRHFCLYVKDELVASLTLSIKQNFARIDDVATIPKYQGNGYATILIKHVIDYVYKYGAKYCFLEANDEAISLYKKCGFEELYMNYIFQS